MGTRIYEGTSRVYDVQLKTVRVIHSVRRAPPVERDRSLSGATGFGSSLRDTRVSNMLLLMSKSAATLSRDYDVCTQRWLRL